MSQDYLGSFPFSESSSSAGMPGTIGAAGGGGSSDHKVLVDSSDTSPGYLGIKLVAGAGISLSVAFPGSNEAVQISNTNSLLSPFGQQSYDYTITNTESAITHNGSPGTDASGTRAWAFVPNATATMNRMRICIRNLGGTLLRLGLYDQNHNLIASTSTFAPVSQSILSVPLGNPVTLQGGVIYYMAYWTNDTTGNLTFPVISGRSISPANPVLQLSDPNQFPASMGNALAFTDLRNWLMISE